MKTHWLINTKKIGFLFLAVIFFTSLLCPSVIAAGRTQTVEQLLASDVEPDGVVFEVLSWDPQTWRWAAPLLKQYRTDLQKKFPDLDVAVVSHGGEQFQLTKDNAAKQPEAIMTLQNLSGEGVNVHVCGTHSSWQDIPESDYLDFINVSPSGPAQINDYLKMGYTRVLLNKPANP